MKLTPEQRAEISAALREAADQFEAGETPKYAIITTCDIDDGAVLTDAIPPDENLKRYFDDDGVRSFLDHAYEDAEWGVYVTVRKAAVTKKFPACTCEASGMFEVGALAYVNPRTFVEPETPELEECGGCMEDE